MRYPKGSIVLSDSLDVPALRKVYQAGHATAWQLYRALNPVFEENKWKCFVRRLGLLSQRDFLLRMVVDGMSAPVFALGDEGAWQPLSKRRRGTQAVEIATMCGTTWSFSSFN
jgi:hypothetical protein